MEWKCIFRRPNFVLCESGRWLLRLCFENDMPKALDTRNMPEIELFRNRFRYFRQWWPPLFHLNLGRARLGRQLNWSQNVAESHWCSLGHFQLQTPAGGRYRCVCCSFDRHRLFDRCLLQSTTQKMFIDSLFCDSSKKIVYTSFSHPNGSSPWTFFDLPVFGCVHCVFLSWWLQKSNKHEKNFHFRQTKKGTYFR